jgi:hypothetical protein|tara:strand:- start:2579 stop:2920 length:342 start_codon:yes stop_codon:yes gene_type:complete
MYKLKVDDTDLKHMRNKLQTSDADMYMSLAMRGADAVRSIRNRIQDTFPRRSDALEIEWNIGISGLDIRVISPSEGLLESVRVEVEDIVNDELARMSADVQRDLGRGLTGAGI